MRDTHICLIGGTMDSVVGSLNNIRFQNNNGFLIGQFKCEDDQITALGNLLRPTIGIDYKLRGRWVQDHKWGKQFRFDSYETVQPKSLSGIHRYLIHTSKWIGPVVAQALIDTYGEETIDVLRTDPARVAKDIRGITLQRANEIQQTIVENEAIESVVIELENLVGGIGLRKSLPIDIANKWGSDAVTILKENPYQLITLHGIGFLSADHLALTRLGVTRTDVNRQKAGLLHLIRENEIAGNIWIYIDDLFRKAEALLGCDPAQGFVLILGHEIVQTADLVSLKNTAYDESFIAKKIAALMSYGKDQE